MDVSVSAEQLLFTIYRWYKLSPDTKELHAEMDKRADAELANIVAFAMTLTYAAQEAGKKRGLDIMREVRGLANG